MRYSDQIIERMFFTGRGRETFPGLLAKWRQFPGKENGMRRPLCAVAICLVIAAAVWLESGGAERAYFQRPVVSLLVKLPGAAGLRKRRKSPFHHHQSTQRNLRLKDLYRRSGILHILSISSLHITILGMSVYRLLRRLGIPVGPAAALSKTAP